jgi:hypothetical protein
MAFQNFNEEGVWKELIHNKYLHSKNFTSFNETHRFSILESSNESEERIL